MKLVFFCLVFLTSVTVSFGQTLWGMGFNRVGQLGDGTKTDQITPVQVAIGVSAMAAGDLSSFYLKNDGSLWAMGWNNYGQLGDGTTTERNTPVQVASGVSAVASGVNHTLYLKTDGSLWAMGYNYGSQLGDGTTTSRSTPIKVATGVSAMAAGGSHSLYLKSDGSLWAMGLNNYGQLGDGSKIDRSTPIQVASGVSAVAASGSHSLYLKSDGSLWAVGFNNYGQLGDGSKIDRSTPIQVASGVSATTAGGYYSFFVKTDGSLWAMGGNTFGQLGDGTKTERSTPVQVASGVLAVSAGSNHSFYLKKSYPRLSNLSVRTALDANQIVIVGFTMSGGSKNVLLRAVGPTLSTFSVPDVMADPKLDLYSGSTKVTTNDNWAGSSALAAAFQAVGSFAYSSTTSLDAALVASIDGSRTAHVSGPTGGVVLVEAYDAGSGTAQKFTSLAARNKVGTGANILIAGFTLSGEGSRNLLIRAVGPTLGAFGVAGTLSDPKLQVYSGSTIVAENDNWSSLLAPTFSSVGAFGLTTGSKDAALTVALRQGNYTVQVSGADGGVGEAIVEIYELP